uniref:Uncharacterized protein n=1 Tax=Rhizophora mucronata TaxID=61149 RepID=A0A2P2NTY3_RHIMU
MSPTGIIGVLCKPNDALDISEDRSAHWVLDKGFAIKPGFTVVSTLEGSEHEEGISGWSSTV